ncbi:MAG: NAD(P)-binding domain-containing protein [Cyclobacteriaceae bacterium]
MMKVAILGETKLARTLGNKYFSRGIEVIFGVREKFEIIDIEWKIFNKFSDKIFPYEEAVMKSNMIMICCENKELNTICQVLLESSLTDKIIIDCTNGVYGEGFNCQTPSIKKLIGNNLVYKAFNNLGIDYPSSDPLGIIQETYYCGKDNENKLKVRRLIELIGFRAIDAGEFDSAALLEAFYHLKMKISDQQTVNHTCHFKLVSF